MTSTERIADKLAAKLLKALKDIENYPFDPDMIADSAVTQLVSLTGVSPSQRMEIRDILIKIFDL